MNDSGILFMAVIAAFIVAMLFTIFGHDELKECAEKNNVFRCEYVAQPIKQEPAK